MGAPLATITDDGDRLVSEDRLHIVFAVLFQYVTH